MGSDERVVVRRHLVQPGPAFDKLRRRQRREASHERRPEVALPAREVAVEVLAGRLVQFRLGDDDAILAVRRGRVIVPPVDAGRVDDDRKAVRPAAGERAAEQVLADRRYRQVAPRHRGEPRREGAGRVHEGVGGNGGAIVQDDGLHAPARHCHAGHRPGDVGRARRLRRPAESGQHLARVGIAVVRAEQAEADVVEPKVRRAGADRVDAQPLDVRAERPLRHVAAFEPLGHRVVDEEEIAALPEPGAGPRARRAHRLVELPEEADAVLCEPDIGGGAELLPDAPHRQERRRAAVGGVPLDDRDVDFGRAGPKAPGDGRSHDASAHDHNPPSRHAARAPRCLVASCRYRYRYRRRGGTPCGGRRGMAPSSR